MNYQLTIIKPDEVELVHEIISKCGLDLKLKLGLSHWVPPYPIQLIRGDALGGNVYGVSDTGQTIATFTISEQPLEYYNTRLWKHPAQRAVYVSHLAVLPKLQGRGIGKWCMKTIEEMAHGWGCETVRLDAYEKYEKLLEFYDNLGYERREVILHNDLRLVCFEKIISDVKSNH